jgi:nicotinamidase/pyrazinamidase
MVTALIVVDVQKDFCEGGSLAVAGGEELGYRLAEISRNRAGYDYVVATKDWHLPGETNGGHFSDNPDYVDTWPAHCVQGTEGAEFHPALSDILFDAVFFKGQGKPAYSGFQGVTAAAAGYVDLLTWLYVRKVEQLDVVGIAADYCVKATALDGVTNGFRVDVLPWLTVAVGGPQAKMAAIGEVMEARRNANSNHRVS